MDYLRKNVRYLRKKNKYTLKRCAAIIGISVSLLSQFESGCCDISFKVVLKLKHLFDVNLDDFVFKDLSTMK